MSAPDTSAEPEISARPPSDVMRLARMGSFHQTRLSFMRVLLRRMAAENWTFTRPVFEISEKGEGTAVYTATGPERSYSLVAFGHDLPPEKRSDRVIATEWDATFTLFDGVPAEADIERLRANVPLQEAGRVSGRELSLARANRSVRLFEHVVSRLAEGRQPDPEQVADVGYLMRTTAVYGSGKFGAADRQQTCDRDEVSAPFQIEMLAVYLIRTFVMDLVEHMARLRAPDRAVPLEASLRRHFGIGNSTGLGMAPFLINHPRLLHHWMATREEALCRVRNQPRATAESQSGFDALLPCARAAAYGWRSEHPIQIEKLAHLRADTDALIARCTQGWADQPYPWDRLWRWGEAELSLEGQELLVALLLEPHGDLVDDLSQSLSADESGTFAIDGRMQTSALRALIEEFYDWALTIDWTAPAAQQRIWYVSEEKLEPRLGEADEDGIADYAQPLAPGRDVAALYSDLSGRTETVAAFLLQHPEHRHAARRVQLVTQFPYGEIRDNTIAADMLPIDLLRAKLSCFGATRFDPRSDRWVRINMFQGAPFPHELSQGADDWAWPQTSVPS